MTEQEREKMGEARVMTRAESSSYNGLTIEADGEHDYGQEFGGSYIRRDRPRNYRVYTNSFGWPWESRNAWLRRGSWQGWLIKAALAAGLVALVVLFVSIILPALLVAAGLVIAGGLVWRFLR